MRTVVPVTLAACVAGALVVSACVQTVAPTLPYCPEPKSSASAAGSALPPPTPRQPD
jgi:hypothetical protein